MTKNRKYPQQKAHYATQNQSLALTPPLTDNEQMLNVRERRSLDIRREVAELIDEFGPGRTAQLLSVHRTTVARWQSQEVDPPEAVRIALIAVVRGQLPGMDSRHWEGWRFGIDGLLYPPGTSRGFRAGHLLSLQYLQQLVAHQRRQLIELEDKLRRADQAGAANEPIENPIRRVNP